MAYKLPIVFTADPPTAGTELVEYITDLERALLAWHDEAVTWLESDYPPRYLRDVEGRLAEHAPVLELARRSRTEQGG